MDVLRTYRELLRNGPLARLLIGEFVSSIGDWLYLVALVVLVYRETEDPIILGIVGAVRMLPYIFLSIPAGIITDRFDRRYVLLASDLARAACMVVLAILVASDGPLWAITVVAMLAASFSTFFYPAIGALLPSLVRDEREFGPANSAWATLDNFAWIVGPGIAGLLLVTGDIGLAFALNAVSFLLIAVILWTLPASKPRPAPLKADDDRRGRLRRPTAGSTTFALPASSWARWAGSRSSRRSAGSCSAASGSSSSSSRPTCSPVATRRPATSTPRSASAGPSAPCSRGRSSSGRGSGGHCCSAPWPSAPRRSCWASPNSLLAAFIAITVLSVGNLVTDVTGTTIFQRAVPDAYRGRFGGVMMTGQVTAETLGTLTVPILVTLFGFGVTFAVLGTLAVAATVLALAMIGGAADLAPSPYDGDLKRIARLPLFGGLSPARIETALRRLDPVEAVAGDVIVRQGDVADRFYVICGGTFRVTQVDGSGVERVAPDARPGRRLRRTRAACPLTAVGDGHGRDRRPPVLDGRRGLPRADRRPGRRPRSPPRALRHPRRDVQPGVAIDQGQRRTR